MNKKKKQAIVAAVFQLEITNNSETAKKLRESFPKAFEEPKSIEDRLTAIENHLGI
jgi:hypothetical protein